jgi:hypothetical protein
MEMKKIKENIVLAIVFMAISGFLYFMAIPWGVPIRASWGGDVGVDSRTFPYFAAAAMGVVAFAFLLVSLSQYAKGRKPQVDTQPVVAHVDGKKRSMKEEVRGLATFGLFLAYGILMVTVGFIVATLIVPVVILLYLGERKLWNFVGVYAFATLLYVIFELLLKVRLP